MSNGLSTTILNSYLPVSFKSSPRVAPPNSSVTPATSPILSTAEQPSSSSSIPVEHASILKPSKFKATPATSVHPMITRAKAKQLTITSPHTLVSSLEPNSIQEALLDSN